MTFGWLEGTNRLEVREKQGRLLALISGDKLVSVKAFLRERGDDWRIPWSGTPIAPVHLKFFRDDSIVGIVGFGEACLTAGPALDYARDIDSHEQAELEKLLGIPGLENSQVSP
jgi:hypothetical protein